MISTLHNPRTFSICALLLLCYAAHVRAECHVSKDGLEYDLSGLDGEHVASRIRETPPTTMTDEVVFNLCAPLELKDKVAEHDQCPQGTSACLLTTNRKDVDSSPERVVSVIPVGQTFNDGPTVTTLKSPKGLQMQWQGAAYPNQASKRQTFTIKLLCEPDTQAGPQFTSYDGETVVVEWRHELACPYKSGEEPPSHDAPSQSAGSSLGWFFLVLIVAFAAYFGLGAYYNYATYGATGYDLIPHRDFWREVPYMLQDVLSHLCSSFRPRHTSSRGGYISV
ncbi:hypothetical protein PENSPDRAFT_617755 [Peniophora sp. CONT]|nr:hypothetical protein PENSPDRAFT_617755 [Peniophora sp. CONT]